MATDVRTMNLSDNGDGMVSLNNNQGTSFVPNIPLEKNVSENKQTMDSIRFPILWAKPRNHSNHQ